MSGRDSDTNGDPLGTPTPGQIALSQPDFQPAYSEQRRSEGGTASASRPTGGLGDPTPGQTILRALQEQQDAMDTIRAGNRRQSVNEDSSESSELQGLNYNGNLSDLFKSPFSPPQGKDEDAIEFEEAGTYDFRKALLAEQRHQQAILQERQMSFDQQYGNSEASGTSPRPSPRLSPKLPPKMAPKADGHPVIVPKSSNSNPPSRPARITNKNRGISAPLGAAPASGPSHKHNRTVSWSLENLETFHSDDPVSDSPNDDAENHALRQSRSLSPTPMTGVGSHRSKAPSRMSLRARGLSEDHTSVNLGNQKINLQDIMGMAPFESEAETNILRALDEFAIQNQGNQREEGSGDAAFFANLPSDFSLSDDLLDSDSERAQPAVDGSPKAKKMDDASKTCMSTSTNHKKKPSDLSTGGLSTHSNYQPPPRPRLASAAMGVSSRQLQSNSSKSQRRFSTVRPRTHRHTQSVEQKLFGLTAQLSKLDGESLTSFHDDEDSLAEEEEKDRKAAQAYKHHRVFSSADKVAQTTHDLVKKAHRREASQLAGSPKKHPSLMRIRTESGDFDSSQRIDLSPDPGKFKRGPLSTILHPRPATPTGDIEAQQETASPTDDVDESNFSKWRRGRDSVSSHGDEGDTSLGFQSNRSNRSIGGASMAKKHHAPTVIDEGDESEGEDEPAKSEREKKSNGKTKRRKKRRSRNPKKILAEGLKEDWEMFNEFLSPRKRSMWLYCKAMLCFVVLPATGIAALLFYVFENPRSLDHNEESDAAVNNETDAAVNDEKNAAVIDVTKASVSWWILFCK